MNALDTMRALAQTSEVRSVRAGDIIFRADDPGSSMFGVLEGTVRLSWTNDNGQGYEVIEAGNVFGAGALVMDGHRRLSTAQAEGLPSHRDESRQIPVRCAGSPDVCH